jgi:hypothetical protein
MKRPLLAATVTLALGFSLAACGSVTGIDDLFTSQSAGAGGAAATTTGQGGNPAVTTGGIGGDGTTSGPTTGAVTSSASGPPMTTGVGSSASSTGAATSSAVASSAVASSSSGGPTNTVFCNGGACNAGEICCFNLTQQNDHCGQAGSCGNGFIELSCNGPEDCPGGVCCADVDFQNNPPYKGIACQQQCNNQQNNLVICSDADPTCPPGKQCGNSNILGQGYKICK